jgi:hypothetical protein
MSTRPLFRADVANVSCVSGAGDSVSRRIAQRTPSRPCSDIAQEKLSKKKSANKKSPA